MKLRILAVLVLASACTELYHPPPADDGQVPGKVPAYHPYNPPDATVIYVVLDMDSSDVIDGNGVIDSGDNDNDANEIDDAGPDVIIIRDAAPDA